MDDQPTITVDATGTASAEPDVARIRLFTFADDPSPGDAVTSCSLLTERVLDALRDAGVVASHLRTTSIELNQHHRKGADEPEPTYRASSGLVATVRPPADAGRIVAAAVDAAGTGVGINGVAFDIDDRAPIESLARRDAVVRAVSAAHELAEAAGLELGRLVELVEGGGRRQPIRRGGQHVPLAAGASVPPVEPGELSVSVTVSATFEVEADTAS